MMLYFRKSPFYPTYEDLEQFREVLDFKQRVAEKGALSWDYDGVDDFEETVRVHLYKAVHSELRNPSRGKGVDDRARRVLAVLESSVNIGQGYRTLQGLARATNLPEDEVKRVIGDHPELIKQSRIPDAKGADLFKIRGEAWA